MIYIISYPRSGNTAFRYIVEMLTERPTNGICGKPNPKDTLQKPLLFKGENFVAHKRHDYKGVKTNDTVFFIVRDYKEAIIRHNKGVRSMDYDNLLVFINNYCELLQNAIDRNDIIIYYENIVEIASEKSKEIYPSPQSGGDPDFHKKTFSIATLKWMDSWVKEYYPDCWQILKRYETSSVHA